MLRLHFVLFFLIFLSFNFFACKNSNENKYIVKTKLAENENDYVLEIKSIKIPCNNLIRRYFTYTILNQQNENYLIGYNPKLSSIDIYNLDKRLFIKRLNLYSKKLSISNLDKKDLDKSRSVNDIVAKNMDSIILNYGNKKIIILDTALRCKKIISLDSVVKGSNIPIKLVSYSHDFKMFFFENRLILKQLYSNYNWEIRVPIFAALNLENAKLTNLPVTYSDYLYNIKGNAGFLSSVITSEFQKNDVMTYNFIYESNIYQYNPKTSTITCYGAKVSKGKNLVDSISYKNEEDINKWVTHHVENPQFFNVIYDKYRRLYYRFSLRDISQRNGNYFNTILDKPLTLMVFNEKFEVIKELDLPMYKYAINTWFLTKEGLFISPTHEKNRIFESSYLKFDIIKISKKK